MADSRADSPGLFVGLDGFDLNDPSLVQHNLGNVIDVSAAGTADPTVSSASATDGSTGLCGTSPISVQNPHSSSASPTVVNGSQSSFQFTPDPSHWGFQDTPPYDSTADAPFDSVPQQTWDLPVHVNPQQFLQQQPQAYYHSPPPASINTCFDNAAVSGSQFPTDRSPAGIEKLVRPDITPDIRNTLTPAQQERLKTIAMPPHLQYHSPKSAGSPDSSSSGHEKGAGSSPDAGLAKPLSRKRKSSAEMDDDDDDDDLDGHQPVKKTAHNMIEKRYRTNLNDKIAALRDSVPALRIMSKSARGEDTTEDREELHGLTPAHKLNKATVLSKATEYIRHLEKRNNRLIEENNSMQNRIAAFEKLFMAGAMTGQLGNPLQQPPTPMQYPQDAAVFMNTPIATPRGSDTPGMIPIPDDMKRIIATQQMNAGRPYPVPPQPFAQTPALIRQQQIQQQQQQQQANRFNPYLGKLMVGTLAGIMLVEALVENEQSNETPEGRGLFAAPISLLGSFVRSSHLSIGGHYISAVDIIAKLRLVSLLAFFGWMISSYFIDMSFFGKPEKPKIASPVMRPAPSLASPIHVRRQAWLTAIQTVWVPRHNFFLEAAALMLKTLKFTLRNVFGAHVYLMLMGLDEEQEAARVKAWSIALDAQLAGGDVEINKSRLTLTLIASGTLPETPLRLMLKALHIRVLLWQFTGTFPAADMIAAKLARSRWNEARQLNQILRSLQAKSHDSDEDLPTHLALLLEQDCDEVLSGDIIQRAHNLAWNKPTRYRVVERIDGMDAVVDDAAVRSPMDAVAAWYSSLILHRALTDSLSGVLPAGTTKDSDEMADEISLAIGLAPIGSNAQVRALVTRATLVDQKRGSNIATAIQALGPSVSPDRYPQYSRGVPPLIDSPMNAIVPDPDAQMALRCAMAIAHLQKYSTPSDRTYMLVDSILPNANVHQMSFLGYTAAFHLMERLYAHPVAREACSRSLERLAGSLRIWIGSAVGQKAGIDAVLRQQMVDRCLGITRAIVGMENDPGYVSMDECDEGDGC
ncbi:sterol regulatory element-binding protein 1 [Echria macrotheca]|uniref:Sterol regulatory element-binding protein 1 n=1 Tax=Echria macrotheca TaxID=438768 RepID=A0AAJ0BE92_9PEZI|nr:sterol regulatory element-binding protein 1 [Echria macrotheca]